MNQSKGTADLSAIPLLPSEHLLGQLPLVNVQRHSVALPLRDGALLLQHPVAAGQPHPGLRFFPPLSPPALASIVCARRHPVG